MILCNDIDGFDDDSPMCTRRATTKIVVHERSGDATLYRCDKHAGQYVALMQKYRPHVAYDVSEVQQ